MCDCLKEKGTNFFRDNWVSEKGQYFVLLSGSLTIHKVDDPIVKTSLGPVSVSGSSAFLINFCPWCGEKMKIRSDLDPYSNTSNRIFIER